MGWKSKMKCPKCGSPLPRNGKSSSCTNTKCDWRYYAGQHRILKQDKVGKQTNVSTEVHQSKMAFDRSRKGVTAQRVDKGQDYDNFQGEINKVDLTLCTMLIHKQETISNHRRLKWRRSSSIVPRAKRQRLHPRGAFSCISGRLSQDLTQLGTRLTFISNGHEITA